MKHTIYDITNYHLVEIERKEPFAGQGIMTTTWNWDVWVAVHETTYKVKAEAKHRSAAIPWMEVQGEHPLTEIIDACKRFMDKH